MIDFFFLYVITRLHADKSLSRIGVHAVHFVLFFAWSLILILTISIILVVAYTTISPLMLLALVPVVLLLIVAAFEN